MKNKEIRSLAREIIDSIEAVFRSKKNTFRGFSSEFKRVNAKEVVDLFSKFNKTG